MRVAMLANARSPHTKRWATAFMEHGHEVHILSIRDAQIDGAVMHRFGVPGARLAGGVGSVLSYLWLLVSARRRLADIGPDVISAHYATTHGVIAALAGQRPIVLTVWGSDLLRGDRIIQGVPKILCRFALRKADAVTAASRHMTNAIVGLAGESVQVHHIPFGVDTSLFRPIGTARKAPPRIGFVKHLKTRYGLRSLIEAFAIVAAHHPDPRLIVVGEGPLRDRISKWLRRKDISDRVDLLGAVNHDDLPPLMDSFDILVNPSLSESFGVVILEASACGLPVVATRVGGTSETVVDGVTGYLVSPGDSAAIASAITELLADPGRRVAMGRAGRRFVEDTYQWDNCVTSMLEVFDSVSDTRS